MKNKLIYALLSLVIALGLWFYVITVVSPESEETYYNIPVVFRNESVLTDKGLMINNQKEPTVTLRLKGNRSDLNNLKNSDILLIADLSKINEVGQQHLSFDISYPGNFADNAFEVLSYSPDRIVLDIVEWTTKVVDVQVEFTGAVPADYIVYKEDYELDQDKVTISGPKTVIDQITHAKAVVDLTDKKSTISGVPYELQFAYEGEEELDLSQVKADITQVTPTIKIQRVKEIQLLVELTYGGGMTQENTEIIYSQQTIKVSGSEALLETLDDTLVLDRINVADLLSDETREYEIAPFFPAEIDNLSGIDKVSVTISLPYLETKVLQITNIVAQNVPAGMTEDIGTKVCNVTVRGAREQIEKITADDLQIIVDLTNGVAGTELYKANVTVINTEYQDVGVVGNYNIAVELK